MMHRFRDPSPNISLVPQVQHFYRQKSIRTQVLPASITSIEECMSLAGVDYITLPPRLIRELASTEADDEKVSSLVQGGSLFSQQQPEPTASSGSTNSDNGATEKEAAFRMAFTRSKGGLNEAKQSKVGVSRPGFASYASRGEPRSLTLITGDQHLL